MDILVDREGSLVHSLFQMGGLYGDPEDAVKKKIDLVTTQTLEHSFFVARELEPKLPECAVDFILFG